jgi:fatty-acyl-CoA synthase
MMYTSGTTGAPKGVRRPLLPADWRGTPPFAADLIALFGVGGDDVRYLSTAPLYHAAPLRFALAVTAGGGSVHVMERFDAVTALELLQREGITHSQWVPAMFQRMLALPQPLRASFQAPAHRCAIHGAAPCAPELKRAMIDWWGPILLEYYSGSEGVGLTLIDSVDALAHPGSVGRARKGTLHIVDDAGREVPTGTTGLVCFSGVAPFEYHNAPEKTAARTLPQGRQTFGDLGHVDREGFLYLTDRQDDMIISGGVNLYPQEIEAAIRNVPGVWDCAVVGVPDERFGERPVAFIVPVRGQTGTDLEDVVRQHCEHKLGRYKRPDAIYVTAELPRSPTGKLLRRELRKLMR